MGRSHVFGPVMSNCRLAPPSAPRQDRSAVHSTSDGETPSGSRRDLLEIIRGFIQRAEVTILSSNRALALLMQTIKLERNLL